MGNRLTKIYTRTGDDGSTGLADGTRVSKTEITFAVMGNVDELNAHIGMISAYTDALTLDNKNLESNYLNNNSLYNSEKNDLLQKLSIVQHLLFNIGGELAMPEYQGITKEHIQWLETDIDTLNSHLAPLKDFILPAGSILVSQVHVARTVCRRAERQAVSLSLENRAAISTESLKLLNRLSDWLFVLARYCTKLESSEEVLWDKAALSKFN